MIPEGRIVGMFLNGHQLNAVIPDIFNSWENMISKLSICRNFSILRTLQTIISRRRIYHSNVRLVDSEAFLPLWNFGLPFIFLSWVPKYSLVWQILGILPWVLWPSWDSIYSFSILLGDAAFKEWVMRDEQRSVFFLRENNRPDAEWIFLTFVCVPVPPIEVSKLCIVISAAKGIYKRKFFGIRSPLSVL
jgi:hypothetical protein